MTPQKKLSSMINDIHAISRNHKYTCQEKLNLIYALSITYDNSTE